MRLIALVLAIAAGTASADIQIVAQCGASSGYSYFFEDEKFPNEEAGWDKDRIPNGKIILVKQDEHWDIQFDDFFGAYSYRKDGAEVVPLVTNAGFITLMAIHQNYQDILTFNLFGGEVAWSSHKTGTPVPKVGVYHAKCKG